jgi:signal transduction histidine kinase
LELSTNGASLSRFVRLQDLFWVVLFAALAIFGPNRSPTIITLLCIFGVFQVMERAILSVKHGNIVSYLVKVALCYLLMAFTNPAGWDAGSSLASSYFWMLLLPVISAATTMGLVGTVIATLVAGGAYLSFLLFLVPNPIFPNPEQQLMPGAESEVILRALVLPVVGYLTHQLAESNRAAARKYQAAAEQLAEANRHLQEAEAAVRRSDRLAALGQLSAGLAHELRNPLGTMKASAEMLSKNLAGDNELAREMAGFISSEVDRTNSLVTRFLDFARPLALRFQETDLSQIIDRAITDIERHQPPFEVSIYKNYSPDIRPFPLDGELMERVIYNLILNAVQASPPRGIITVKTRQIGDIVEIAVIDRGSGIDPKHIENIFNPFFTTKREGVGLGLAIVSKIVDEHGGRMTVESEPGQGSVFRVYLPMEPPRGTTNE